MIKLLLLQTISALQEIKAPAQSLSEQFNQKYIEYLEIKLNELNVESLTAPEVASFFSHIWSICQNTFLSYTASHQSILSGILIKLAVETAKELGQNPLNVLMPGLSIESISDEYPDLKLDYSVESVVECLKKHVISDNAQYLIPIKLPCSQELSVSSHTKFLNPYYNFDTMDEASLYLSELELQRIENHSSDITALFALKKQYFHLLSDDKSLLSELFNLLDSLYINGAHGGVGKQDNAGQDVYMAIIHFNAYYQLLTPEVRSLIPIDLRKEIELLLSLASDPLANSDATANLETCIASRRDKLAISIKNHQLLLGQIALQDQPKAILISDVFVKYQILQKRLLNDIEINKYNFGFEKLGLSIPLISVLNFQLNLQSKQVFEEFLELPAKDISLFCDVMDLSTNIVSHFFTLDDFIYYVITAEASRLKVLLTKFSKLFADSFFVGTPYFSYFLSLLSDKHLEIVFEAFKEHLLDIIHDGYHLSHVMHFLAPTYQEQVLTSLMPILPILITRALEVQCLLGAISPKSFQMVFPLIKPLLQQLVIDAELFNKITASLNTEQIKECFAMHHYYLKYTIANMADIELVIEHLDDNTREAFIAELSDILPAIIKDSLGFFKLLNLCSVSQRYVFFELFETQLPELIATGEDFIACLVYFSMDYREKLCMLMAEKMPLLMVDYLYLGHVLRFLDPPLQYNLLLNLKSHLPFLANTPRKVACILDILDEELKNWFFNQMLKYLIWQINYSDDLISIIKHISDKDVERLLIKLDGKLQKIIPLASHLRDIIENLSSKNTKLLIILLGEDIRKLVGSGYHFSKLVKGLSTQKIIDVYNLINYFLPEVITSVPDFFKVIEYLPVKQKNYALHSCLFKLIDLIHDIQDFSNLLSIFEPDDLALFLNHVGPKTKLFTNHIYDFHYMMSKLKATQRKLLFSYFLEKIISLVSKVSDYVLLSEVMDTSQLEVIFDNTLDVLSTGIQSKNQLARLIKVLEEQQIKKLLESLDERITMIINKPSEFKFLALYLSPESTEKLFIKLRDHLLANSRNFFQLTQFLSLISPITRDQLFPVIIKQMICCVHGPLDSQLYFETLSSLEIAQSFQMMPIKQKIAATITKQTQFLLLENYYEKKLACKTNKSFAEYFLEGLLLNVRELIIDEQVLGELKPSIIKLYHQFHYAMSRKDNITTKRLLLDSVHESLNLPNMTQPLHTLLKQLSLAIEMKYPTSLLQIGFFSPSNQTCEKILAPVLK